MTTIQQNKRADTMSEIKFPVFSEHSYESRLFYWLHWINETCAHGKIDYALFGGSAVASYIGHLPRKLHDLDCIVKPTDLLALKDRMLKEGFTVERSSKSVAADFLKMEKKNHTYDVIVSFFPSVFTLLDLTKQDLPVIGSYSFQAALENAVVRWLHPLGGEGKISLRVVPLEDLLISKLWPAMEPNTLSDLTMLLSCEYAKHLDWNYFRERVASSERFRPYMISTLEKFIYLLPHTHWRLMTKDSEHFSETLKLLKSNLVFKGVGRPQAL